MDAREALRPILVAASAISNLRATVAAANSNAAVQAAAEKIAKLSEQLTAARRLSSAPTNVHASAVAPMWTPAATPVVEVAASAAAVPAPEFRGFVIPEVLRMGGLPSFTESGVGRVTREMMPGRKNQM